MAFGIAVLAAGQGEHKRRLNFFMQHTGFCLLGVAAMLLALFLGASLIASERSQQTLDVLLTTPLRAHATSSRRKVAALRRILIVVMLPALLCVCGRFWLATDDIDTVSVQKRD